MSADDARANKLMADATESVSKFAFFTSKEEKRANARKMYLQAAGLYKASSNFIMAANAYQRAADMSKENNDEISLPDDLHNVMLAQLKCDNFDAANAAARQVVDLYMRANKTGQCARVAQEMAEYRPSGGAALTDEQRREQDTWLEKAMTFYRQEGSRATANELRLRAAERKAQAGQYEIAASEYEKIAKEMLDDQLLRATALRHLFMALLCQLASLQPSRLVDMTDSLRRKFEAFQDLDPQFTRLTQEHILFTGILDALESEDVDKFEEVQERYSEICAVDGLKAKLLFTGKAALRQAVDGGAR